MKSNRKLSALALAVAARGADIGSAGSGRQRRSC